MNTLDKNPISNILNQMPNNKMPVTEGYRHVTEDIFRQFNSIIYKNDFKESSKVWIQHLMTLLLKQKILDPENYQPLSLINMVRLLKWTR